MLQIQKDCAKNVEMLSVINLCFLRTQYKYNKSLLRLAAREIYCFELPWTFRIICDIHFLIVFITDSESSDLSIRRQGLVWSPWTFLVRTLILQFFRMLHAIIPSRRKFLNPARNGKYATQQFFKQSKSVTGFLRWWCFPGERNATLPLVMIKYRALRTIFALVETRIYEPARWQHCQPLGA